MRSLKTEQCEALRLQYWEGLSVNEIAVVMKRSPAAVNSLLQRARKTIFERGKNYFLKDEVTS
jgi:DNA-directed RNA polymerase specialized sigma24 family protein